MREIRDICYFEFLRLKMSYFSLVKLNGYEILRFLWKRDGFDMGV